VAYGFVPTLQNAVVPQRNSADENYNQNVVESVSVPFSRVYAVYGGVFVISSYLWGWLADGSRPDVGDIVGGVVALAGVAVAWFWPRAARSAAAG